MYIVCRISFFCISLILSTFILDHFHISLDCFAFFKKIGITFYSNGNLETLEFFFPRAAQKGSAAWEAGRAGRLRNRWPEWIMEVSLPAERFSLLFPSSSVSFISDWGIRFPLAAQKGISRSSIKYKKKKMFKMVSVIECF